MGKINTFKDIIAWQKAHGLALEVYKATSTFPRSEEFALSSQMRRAAVSIPSNIAEGFSRKTLKDTSHFYNISEGSLEELKYQLLLARDLLYIKPADYDKLSLLSDEVGKVLCVWKRNQKY